MFDKFKVQELRRLISAYRKYHNISGYYKMKKIQLVAELNKRFVIHEGKLMAKPQGEPLVQKKKRITAEFIGTLPTGQPSRSYGSEQVPRQQSKAMQRLQQKASELDQYYKRKGNVDEYPEYGF